MDGATSFRMGVGEITKNRHLVTDRCVRRSVAVGTRSAPAARPPGAKVSEVSEVTEVSEVR